MAVWDSFQMYLLQGNMKKRNAIILIGNLLISATFGVFGIGGFIPVGYEPTPFFILVGAAFVGTSMAQNNSLGRYETLINGFIAIVFVTFITAYYQWFSELPSLNGVETYVWILLFIIVGTLFYLTTSGLKHIFSKPVVKLLFFSSYPEDQSRLTSEFDEIVESIKSANSQKIEIKILKPIISANYKKLITGLTHRPKIIHYSGHGNSDGIFLIDNKTNNSLQLSNDKLESIFKNCRSLKLIFFNSCFSEKQAEILSKQGMFVLGLEDEIENSVAVEFAKEFYYGFVNQGNPVSLEQGIQNGCMQFSVKHQNYEKLISLWQNGLKINYQKLKPKK